MMLTVRTSPQVVTAENIETGFLEFFHGRGDAILPGSPLVDEGIQMSFVMSAGLAQVEHALSHTGRPLKKQFALVQSCFRHFDMMESFGYSNLHLSFFRMAGAFHFGFIDQRNRVVEVWDLLSSVYSLAPDSLWVTYFSGGEILGEIFEPDVLARQSWLNNGIHPDHIVAREDNLWKQSRLMDSTGYPKFGPISEVFWDRGMQFACGPDCLPGCHCGRFVEFLNMLFIGWEQDLENRCLRPLEEPFVEVVIGVERLAMVLQGASSVYEVEGFPLLLSILDEFLGSKAICGVEREHQMRLLADHLRAMLFLVADGAPPPGRGGRARIMRRLARNLLVAQKLLDLPVVESGLVSPAITVLLEQLLGFYREEQPLPGQQEPRMLASHPNLNQASAKILNYLNAEAGLFEQTLQNGLRKLERMLLHRAEHRLSGKEMLEIEISDGVPVAYLMFILDRGEIAYSWAEYQSARQRWQESNAFREDTLARTISRRSQT